MISSTRDPRRGRFASVGVALLILTGCANTAPAQQSASEMPSSVASSATAGPAESSAAQSSDPATTQSPVMAASPPVSLNIPSIREQSTLLHLGLRANGSLEVPPDGPTAPASWYNGSPTPGERGPAVLLGHVNAVGGGPGVFANLRRLKVGDTLEVTRADGKTAIFEFYRGEQFAKDAFPSQTVYGDTEGSELRVITCDGYDPATGLFDDNYVVFAKLVSPST
ncbi:hypothetical protein J2X01_002904 [Arthrobacter ginsengisoli]|uniref:Class F sortase n=1 Tax=Arthrobacter ginsengisoli TaxID=1356565 RepID=A0ABU1UEI4_9MICC|nr:sortase [Arthrobacter ginsengisoli]MDR7083609.1 hypothetical protein [Arthrobacter ginsengisoli]